MDKYSFVREVANEAGVSQETVNKVFKAMATKLVPIVRDNGETVVFTGLGMFKPKNNPPRIGRNPSNGDSVDIPASRTIAFKPSAVLKVVEE